MSISKLNDNWVVAGKDFAQFKNEIAALDARTISVPLKLDEIHIHSLLKPDDATKVGLSDDPRFMYFVTSQGVLEGRYPSLSEEKKLMFFDKNQMLSTDGGTEDLLDEVHRIGAVITVDGKVQHFYASAHFFEDMARRLRIGGSRVTEPSRKRDEYFTSCMLEETNQGAKITVRFDGQVAKAFSLNGGSYRYIPQEILVKTVEKLDGLGKIEFKDYEMGNFMTVVHVSLPECQADFAATYGLDETLCEPGLEFRTSDTGDANVMALPMLSLRKRNPVPLETCVRRRHFGNVADETFIDRVNTEVFADYKHIPERLSTLAQMKGLIPLREGLAMGFKAMKLDAQYAKEAKINELIDFISAEEGADEVNAFRLVELLVYAYETEGVISATTREHMRTRAMKAIFAPFEDIEVKVSASA